MTPPRGPRRVLVVLRRFQHGPAARRAEARGTVTRMGRDRASGLGSAKPTRARSEGRALPRNRRRRHGPPNAGIPDGPGDRPRVLRISATAAGGSPARSCPSWRKGRTCASMEGSWDFSFAGASRCRAPWKTTTRVSVRQSARNPSWTLALSSIAVFVHGVEQRVCELPRFSRKVLVRASRMTLVCR